MVVLALAACSTGVDRPPDCDASAVERSVALGTNAKLDPQTINVCGGQQVTLTVMVQADGVLHIHGYDDEAQARSVSAGTDATLTFRASHVGQFVIELHTRGSSAGIGAGVLTVHER